MIIHFWSLPENRNYITLKEELKKKIIKELKNKKYSWKLINRMENKKISIQKIKAISKKEDFSLSLIEENILWIGGNNSRGLSNPKFPINFRTRNGARFIAAIVNDGTLTKESKNGHGKLMYDNFDESLRNSVMQDYMTIFGGNKNEIAFRNTEKKKYLEFSSVIRDIVELVIKDKGPKCESNILLPSFILKDKETMAGWIEQTIADEGEVKHYPTKSYADRYRRAIIWRRSLDVTNTFNKKINKTIAFGKLSLSTQKILLKLRCNLIESEKEILRLMGVNYSLYNLGIYPTIKNKIRTRWQIGITKRENLLKLRKLIKIPSVSKDKKFKAIVKEFVRYKEPLKIKEAILNLGENGKLFTSLDLVRKMNYKQTNTAIKWIKTFEKQNLIRKAKESSYGNGKYRQPAVYELIQDK
ncbi:MAG: hypothetical protein PHH54_03905 [Candidatus Nanoarchaeia archaeon]|nr:hypothetical protein [Candidatus Nanoarchaeia archaeon]MDD5741104.1 hypothetical protein [Candidatus Nanoarchaeia archaeon]